MGYNRYMTGDRNQNLGESISKKNSKFCNYSNCKKTAIYNYMFMKPKFCFDHKNEYIVNIRKKNIDYVHIIINHILRNQNVLNVKLKNQQNVINVILQQVIILKN